MTTPHRKFLSGHGSILFLSGIAILLGVLGGFVAQLLIRLIGLVTNLSFYGRFSTEFTSPAENHLGILVIFVPVIGGLIVGLMARYGSKAIRGHGIPEAMEQVLENNSRIPARVTFLKPISAAISIGTGGPFGAEGPIISTGGALGSVLGQFLSTTPAERKTLLAAGAAAGMAAIFGSPISAVLLAIELLLFEFRARSLIPLSLAAATAAGMRIHFEGSAAIFALPNIEPSTLSSLVLYSLIGVLVGVASVGVTRAVYWTEDFFERLPIHWMWWPALGAVAVGVIGYFAPRTLGVGYGNISDILSDNLPLHAIAFLCGMKFISWTISLGSGTSGGTLAPLLTIGSGVGSVLGAILLFIFPASGLDVRVAALVGMAAMFAGASRALLTSVVFAFETTLQPMGLLPLLAGSTLAFLTARLLMQNSIMTERIARRGLRIPQDYDVDVYFQTSVEEMMSRHFRMLPAESTIDALAERIARHDPEISTYQAWLLAGPKGELRGIITRQDLMRALEKTTSNGTTLQEAGSTKLVTIYPDETMHEAVARMLRHGIGRLPVISRENPTKVIGYLSRTSLLSARLRKLQQETIREKGWLASLRK